MVYTGPLTKKQLEVEEVLMGSIENFAKRRRIRRFRKLDNKQGLAREIHRKLSEEGIIKKDYHQ